MSERLPSLLVQDILNSIETVKSYTDGMTFEEFTQDYKTRDAVVMHFIVIGEMTNRFPEQFKNAQPHIPWNEMRALRNRIVHDYFGIDYGIVWEIIQDNFDELAQQLLKLKI